ncbi:DSBA-like thioredoxin domain containing protein [Metarhizium guizhouense ARSEF 977]|uniref:DSBA-like thioredoxin domain containing protein n=1 Tax=Metarhizium guizhouense (strain ARSEF 977) TaxID=1276136 RepID=A0A0B4H8N1_METGA|nr:DSBA-like thioredoxin domain containing protein [Metarhizium guizhouense ARSEF 977]
MAAMEMFFEEGGDFTSWDDLAGGAETAGIEAAETKAWLEGGGGEQVDSDVEQAHERGVERRADIYD